MLAAADWGGRLGFGPLLLGLFKALLALWLFGKPPIHKITKSLFHNPHFGSVPICFSEIHQSVYDFAINANLDKSGALRFRH
jgi:hypothetical protein